MSASRKPQRSAGVLLALVLSASAAAHAQYPGWLIPAGGKDEKSPVASVPDAVTRGKAVYIANCARCHGPEGKGNGPDSDHAADLTDELRFDINTDGVLFYKIWNGHAIQLRTQVDDMPPFDGKLSRDQVWTVVEYVKSLRKPVR